jgi:hypothetical protein
MTAGNGVLATITTATTTTITNDTLTCTTDGYGVKLLRKGQRILVYDAGMAAPLSATPSKIIAYDLVNKKIQIDATLAGVAPGCFIVPEGLSGANPVGLFGVPYHNNNSTVGNWLGLPRATTPEVQANRVNAASAALAPAFARRAINAIGDRMGMDNKPH